MKFSAIQAHLAILAIGRALINAMNICTISIVKSFLRPGFILLGSTGPTLLLCLIRPEVTLYKTYIFLILNLLQIDLDCFNCSTM